MKTIIHVNQHRIRSNTKNKVSEPVLTVKTYRTNQYASEVSILGHDGLEAARIIYRPHKPLSCGARCWIEVPDHNQVTIEG